MPPFQNMTLREVQIEDTTFYFYRMLPLEALAMLEVLRQSIKDMIGLVDIDTLIYETPYEGDEEGGVEDSETEDKKLNLNMIEFAKLISHIPPEFVADVIDVASRHTYFENSRTSGKARLEKNIEVAFEDLDPIFIYEVLIRWLFVNFSKSFNVMLSRLGATPQDLVQQNTETSTQ